MIFADTSVPTAVLALIGLLLGSLITGGFAVYNARAERSALKPYKEKELAIDGLNTSVTATIASVDRLEKDNERLDKALAKCLERDTAKALLIAEQGTQINTQAVQINSLTIEMTKLRDRLDARNGIDKHPDT